jgi:hypothetical protein
MRSAFESVRDKKNAVKEAEKDGSLADSHEVRLAIMARVHSGEITLEHAQKELKRIKSAAAANGKMTRAQVFQDA